MKRTGFKRPTLEQVRAITAQLNTPEGIPRIERFTFVTSPPLHRGVYARSGAQSARPKRDYVRSAQLLANVGKLHYCTLTDHHAPVMPCHSNWEIHGKGKNIKADDNRVAAGCLHCHYELDFGTQFTEAERQSIWWRGHVQTVQLLLERDLWPARVPVPDTTHNPFAAEPHHPGDPA